MITLTRLMIAAMGHFRKESDLRRESGFCTGRPGLGSHASDARRCRLYGGWQGSLSGAVCICR